LRILLDEDVSQPLLEPLRRILKPHAVDHVVDHVNDIVWKGKKDVQVLRDAPVRGYGMLVTHNLGQLRIPTRSRRSRGRASTTSPTSQRRG